MSTEQQPQQLTVKEALEQGYTRYIGDGEEVAGYLSDIEMEETDLSGTWWLVEKESTTIEISANEIYEDLADNFSDNHELYDDDNSFRDLIISAVDWEAIAAQINEKLKTRPVFFPTSIKLIPNDPQ